MWRNVQINEMVGLYMECMLVVLIRGENMIRVVTATTEGNCDVCPSLHGNGDPGLSTLCIHGTRSDSFISHMGNFASKRQPDEGKVSFRLSSWDCCFLPVMYLFLCDTTKHYSTPDLQGSSAVCIWCWRAPTGVWCTLSCTLARRWTGSLPAENYPLPDY